MLQAAKAVTTAALILGFSSVALADNEPPARYASGPYLKPLRVLTLPVSDIAKICGHVAQGGKMERVACAVFYRFSCYVYIANQLPSGWRPGVLEHEKAHCRGWPANHPA